METQCSGFVTKGEKNKTKLEDKKWVKNNCEPTKRKQKFFHCVIKGFLFVLILIMKAISMWFTNKKEFTIFTKAFLCFPMRKLR